MEQITEATKLKGALLSVEVPVLFGNSPTQSPNHPHSPRTTPLTLSHPLLGSLDPRLSAKSLVVGGHVRRKGYLTLSFVAVTPGLWIVLKGAVVFVHVSFKTALPPQPASPTDPTVVPELGEPAGGASGPRGDPLPSRGCSGPLS